MTVGNDIERIQDLIAGLNYVVSLTIERIDVGMDCEPADVIAKAFPQYPVFWGFSFMLRFNDYSNIWIDSSSD